MKNILLVVASAVLLAVIGFCVFRFLVPERFKDLQFHLVFSSSDNIAPGLPVKHESVQIGTVRAFELRGGGEVYVKVLVPRKHRQAVREGAVFVLKREHLFSGPYFISMEDPGPASAPLIRNGAIVRTPRPLRDVLQDAAHGAGRALRNARENILGQTTGSDTPVH